MCYEFDWFHEKVRIAEELRKWRPSAEQPKQRSAEDSVKPAQAEEHGEKRQPVPA